MVASLVPFVPPFVLGLFFVLGPSFAIALLAGDTAGAAAVALVSVAAFVWPKDNFYLSCVLCALRTAPLIYLAIILVSMRVLHVGPPSYPILVAYVVVAGAAQWRIRGLVRSGGLAI